MPKGMKGVLFDPRLHHWQRSKKQVVLIEDMDENHIINAILLQFKEWFQAIREADSMEEVVVLLKNAPSDEIHIRSLVHQLERIFPS